MDELIVPDGKARGCLPRKSQVGEWCNLLTSAMPTLSRDKWKLYIGKVSLRPFVTQILDQDGVGSCATESATQGEMVCRARAGYPFELLNPWSIYHFTSHGSDNGSSLDENLAFVRDNGVLPESYWPRSKGWKATPPDGWKQTAAHYRLAEFWEVTNTEEAGSALLCGFPVVFGWGGHSCLLTTLLSDTVAEYVNSWGKWGDQGFGQIKLASINFQYGCFAYRVAKPD